MRRRGDVLDQTALAAMAEEEFQQLTAVAMAWDVLGPTPELEDPLPMPKRPRWSHPLLLPALARYPEEQQKSMKSMSHPDPR